MSYSFMAPCYNCKKRKRINMVTEEVEGTCTDYDTQRAAIDKIHSTKPEEGHQGSGAITLMCINFEKEVR